MPGCEFEPRDGSFKLENFPKISPQDICPKIRFILVYIDSSYFKVIYLKDLASQIGICPEHLCRLFKDQTGMLFYDYLEGKRIYAASLLLRNSHKSIKIISAETGFSRPEVFSKAFKRRMGISPTSYRSKYFEPPVIKKGTTD